MKTLKLQILFLVLRSCLFSNSLRIFKICYDQEKEVIITEPKLLQGKGIMHISLL